MAIILPTTELIKDPVVGPSHRRFSIGDLIGGNNWGNASWITNAAYYVPISLPSPYLVTHLALTFATGVTGNIDLGVYDRDTLQLLFSTGSQARSAGTANIANLYAVGPYLLRPGRYYLAAASDNNATSFRCNHAAATQTFAGVRKESSAFPLPSTATPVDQADAFLPFVAIRSM